MPILSNVRWENFARGIVAGEFAVKAYVDAGFSRHGARQATHKLRNHPRVEKRIAELQCRPRKV
jgi:hypothetical protein